VTEFTPINDLDRAIQALRKSKAATPDFYRALSEGELWFPVKYHPEMEDGTSFSIENGSPIPFPLLADDRGRTYVPIYSSGERFDESLRKSNIPERTYLAASMPAKQLLEILSKMDFWAQVNKACATGSLMVGPDLMRDLASGKALKPLGTHGEDTGLRHMRIVPPEEFPTNLIQPIFEFLRQHREFRAAFVLTPLPEMISEKGRRSYLFGIVMEPEDETLFHDLNVVIAAACADKYEFEPSAIATEEVGPYFQAGAPFFRAPDYQPPSG